MNEENDYGDLLWSPEKLRTIKGYENYTDEKALKTIKSIDRLARILLPILKKNIQENEQSESVQPIQKRKRHIK